MVNPVAKINAEAFSVPVEKCERPLNQLLGLDPSTPFGDSFDPIMARLSWLKELPGAPGELGYCTVASVNSSLNALIEGIRSEGGTIPGQTPVFALREDVASPGGLQSLEIPFNRLAGVFPQLARPMTDLILFQPESNWLIFARHDGIIGYLKLPSPP